MAVYFIEGAHGAIKVGFVNSTEPKEAKKAVKARIKMLQTGSPVKLKLLNINVYEGKACEKRFHDLLAKFRLEGEWFSPSPEVLAVANGAMYRRDLENNADPPIYERGWFRPEFAPRFYRRADERCLYTAAAAFASFFGRPDSSMVVNDWDILENDPGALVWLKASAMRGEHWSKHNDYMAQRVRRAALPGVA